MLAYPWRECCRLAGLNYAFIFDKNILKHPKLLPNQVFREIYFTLEGIPVVGFLTTSVFFLELKGYSLIYDDPNQYGWAYMALSVLLFLFFTGMCTGVYVRVCVCVCVCVCARARAFVCVRVK